MVRDSCFSQGIDFFNDKSKNLNLKPSTFMMSTLKFPFWRDSIMINMLKKKELDRMLANKIAGDIYQFKNLETITHSYFNKINIAVKIKQFTEHFKKLLSEEQIDILYSIVLLSRKSSNLQIASSNAITILNYMDFSFSNKDLRGIKAIEADLSGCNFINVDLRNSNLREANLVNSYFYNVNLENCDLSKALFGKSKQIIRKNEEFTIKFSPSGKYFVCLPSAIIWNTESLRKVAKVPVWASSSGLSFSPCEKYIAFWCFPAEIIIWDIGNNIQYKRLINFDEDSPGFLLFLPSGTSLLAASKKTIQLWSLLSEEISKSETFNSKELITSASICQAGSLLMVCWESSVEIYEIETFKLVRKITTGRKVICNFLSRTKLLFCDDSEHLYTWDLQTQDKAIIKSRLGSATSISSNLSKGIIATSCYNRKIKIRDIESQKSIWKYRCPDYSQNINCLLSPDGKILAVCFNKIIKFFFVEEVIKAKAFIGHSASVIDHISIYGNDKFIISRDRDAQAIVWDITKNKIIEKYDSKIKWNVWMYKSLISIVPHTEQLLNKHLFKKYNGLVSHFTMSSCQRFTAYTFKSWKIFIYDEITNEIVSTIHCDNDPSSFLITKNGEYLICRHCHQNNLSIWNIKSCQKIRTIGTISANIQIACSDKHLAISSTIIILFDLATGKEIEPLKSMDDEIRIAAFSNCGKYIATSGATDYRIFISKIKTWEIALELCGHKGGMMAIFFSETGKLLASASNDMTIKLWNIDKKSSNYGYLIWSTVHYEFDIHNSNTQNIILSSGKEEILK